MTRRDLVAAFRRLHHRERGSILVLPNAWDAMSARVVEQAGAAAIATTSAGVSWGLGRPDGHGITREEAIAVVRRIASVVGVPVTADLEGGYGDRTPQDVAATVREVVDAGAVGINLEDAPGRSGGPLLEPSEQAERIAAARAAAGDADLFINARVDVYLVQVGTEAGRVDETIRRARAYVTAGADGVFVPGVVDAATIRRLVDGVGAPLNVMAGPGAPGVAELARLGVARVSVGPSITLAVMGRIRRAATELLETGSYEALRDGMSFREAQALFDRSS
jgi:2-methylisocitrate lyase-like PEP mutase family enzyme